MDRRTLTCRNPRPRPRRPGPCIHPVGEPRPKGSPPVRLRTCLLLLVLPLSVVLPSEPVSFADGDTVALDTLPLTGCRKVQDPARGCEAPVRLEPAPLGWEDARHRLGPDARIPLPGTGELSYEGGSVFSKKEVRTVDLSERVPQWLAMRFDSPAFEAPEPWMKSLGDILERFQKTRGDAAAQETLLGVLQTRASGVWDEVRVFLPEWVRDDYLYSESWTPQKTGRPAAAENDGILERPPFLRTPAPGGPEASGGTSDSDRKVYQACAPVFASLEDLFTAENDFATYYRQAGANYREVFPLDGTSFAGTDPAGSPFLLYDVSYFQKPLPLWNLRFKLRQFLHRDGGRWQMENRLLEGDMNVLRLRIFYDPIHTLDGRVIGHVKTEWLDVDIRGLPDGDSDRQAGVRGDVGNIKRAAEERSGARKAAAR